MRIISILIAVLAAALFAATTTAQEHHDHNQHEQQHDSMEMNHDHHDHAHHEQADQHHDGHAETSSQAVARLTRIEDIEAALSEGGEPIVADVLGVVCDFCAIAMNKIFSKRDEVAAIYVDLDTKALSIVLAPGANLSDEMIADLAVQAGYRVAGIRRGNEALGNAS